MAIAHNGFQLFQKHIFKVKCYYQASHLCEMSQSGNYFASLLLHFDLCLYNPFRPTYSTHQGILGEVIQFVKTKFSQTFSELDILNPVVTTTTLLMTIIRTGSGHAKLVNA